MNREQMETHLTLKGWVLKDDDGEPTAHDGVNVVYLRRTDGAVCNSDPGDISPAGYEECPYQAWASLTDGQFWAIVNRALELEWL